MSIRSAAITACLTIVLAVTPAVAQGGWTRYADRGLGYTIDLPSAGFQRGSARANGIQLVDPDDGAQLNVFGSEVDPGVTPSALLSEVQRADRISKVTYRKRGEGWFVVSGYYVKDGGEDENLIFYAKFMFNRDRTAFSAFEISYPRSEKRAFDGIVTHLEKSLRAPR